MLNRRHVAVGTISLTVCFAAWGLISAFAPRFREILHLTASETALLVAVPVLLGSLARIPMGILTDRFGGRAVFSILMVAVAVPVWLVPQQPTYLSLLTVAFLLGLAGSSFAIGVGYVSRWTPPDRQGSALGVYGLGNIGQSAAVFLGPVLAAQVGMPAPPIDQFLCCAPSKALTWLRPQRAWTSVWKLSKPDFIGPGLCCGRTSTGVPA